MNTTIKSIQHHIYSAARQVRRLLWSNRSRPGKAMTSLGVALVMLLSTSYGIAYWYQQQLQSEPLVFGATFISRYAEELGVDPKETLQASIDELGLKRFRLVSYWNEHEPAPDEYDFSDLDWQFDMIEQAGGEISLALGLRQPRWPECHGPKWAMSKPMNEWSQDLQEYIEVVIERYKDRNVLVEYQLENEFFLSVFGECPDFSRQRLIDEFELVKSLDPSRPVIVNRSNNAVPSWPVGEPRADRVGAAVYKRTWDETVTRRYFEYPFPPWFYSFLAGGTKLTTGVDSFIHELQTEAWLPPNQEYGMRDAPIDELYKSMSPNILQERLRYGVDTGMRTIDLWGIEWWYQMKVERNAPELWQTVKTELDLYRQYN